MLLDSIERRVASTFTGSEVTSIMGVISDELEWYDLSVRTRDVENWNQHDDMLEAFLTAKAIEGRSEKTITRYKYIIEGFLKSANTTARNVTVYHMRKYLADGKSNGLSDVTLNGYRDIFCSFFNWLQREALIPSNPCSNLNKIKCIREVKIPFSDMDI
jgi:site-specific recombinase XerD